MKNKNQTIPPEQDKKDKSMLLEQHTGSAPQGVDEFTFDGKRYRVVDHRAIELVGEDVLPKKYLSTNLHSKGIEDGSAPKGEDFREESDLMSRKKHEKIMREFLQRLKEEDNKIMCDLLRGKITIGEAQARLLQSKNKIFGKDPI